MTTNAELHARREAAVPRGWGSVFPIYIERARGAEIWDVEGRRYIDFAGGIAVLNTGHLHPRVSAAVAAQLENLSHACFMVTPYESAVTLAERLNGLLAGNTPKKTLFLNSGAEAVENAVKIARYHTGRPALIAFSGAFHGRTMMALSLTGKVTPYKQGFGPLPGPVVHVPYPDRYHRVSVDDSLTAIHHLFKEELEPELVAGIVVEPVLGEGGFVPAPFKLLSELRTLCDRYGILLVVDEVQTGFARTGRMFALDYSGIEADLVTLAKSLGGGFVLSAVVGKAPIMDSVHPGGLGGTYGGNPLACAAALAVLDVIEEENLLARSVEIGSLITERLTTLASRFPAIGDVRGLGAMVGMELVQNRDPEQPDPELTSALIQKCAENGLIILSCGTRGNVVRFLVPLTADDRLIDEGLDILEKALGEV